MEKKLPEKKKQVYQRGNEKNKAQFEANLTTHFIETFPESSPPKSAFDLCRVGESKDILQDEGKISNKKLRKQLKWRWENQEERVIEYWKETSKEDAEEFPAKAAKHKKRKAQSS